ncbi:hypothetical protein LSTR_LSTR015526 [Laodelphax striatellus]|uniref:Uncharacterized protein n=1 Tax=Laodelphax striatellus TaxID=195883 RepID=A0A482WUM9_LAOST|nr:hypothetical protein LSTR_LSTR015526 [Laodelphax striatellus]
MSLDSVFGNPKRIELHDAGCQTDDLFMKDKDELITRINELLIQRDALIKEVQDIRTVEYSDRRIDDEICFRSIGSQTHSYYGLSTEQCKPDCESLNVIKMREKTIQILNDNNDSLYREIRCLEKDIDENKNYIKMLIEENNCLSNIVSKLNNQFKEHEEKNTVALDDFHRNTRKIKILANMLNNELSSEFLASSFVYGGAGMTDIVDAVSTCDEVKSLNKNDFPLWL